MGSSVLAWSAIRSDLTPSVRPGSLVRCAIAVAAARRRTHPRNKRPTGHAALVARGSRFPATPPEGTQVGSPSSALLSRGALWRSRSSTALDFGNCGSLLETGGNACGAGGPVSAPWSPMKCSARASAKRAQLQMSHVTHDVHGLRQAAKPTQEGWHEVIRELGRTSKRLIRSAKAL